MDIGPKELRIQGLQVASKRLPTLAVYAVGNAVGGDGVVAFREEEGGEKGGNARVPHGGHKEVLAEILHYAWLLLKDRVYQKLHFRRLGCKRKSSVSRMSSQ